MRRRGILKVSNELLPYLQLPLGTSIIDTMSFDDYDCVHVADHWSLPEVPEGAAVLPDVELVVNSIDGPTHFTEWLSVTQEPAMSSDATMYRPGPADLARSGKIT